MKLEVTSVKYEAKLLAWSRLILKIDLYMDEGWKMCNISEFDLYCASTLYAGNKVLNFKIIFDNSCAQFFKINKLLKYPKL
jgi:hypothetical protein